jgi:hypothetical protein
MSNEQPALQYRCEGDVNARNQVRLVSSKSWTGDSVYVGWTGEFEQYTGKLLISLADADNARGLELTLSADGTLRQAERDGSDRVVERAVLGRVPLNGPHFVWLRYSASNNSFGILVSGGGGDPLSSTGTGAEMGNGLLRLSFHHLHETCAQEAYLVQNVTISDCCTEAAADAGMCTPGSE